MPLAVEPQDPRGAARVMIAISDERILAREVAQPALAPYPLGSRARASARRPRSISRAMISGYDQERAAVGMVGREGDSPRVVDPQEPFQADRPLQRVHVVAIVIRDRARSPQPSSCSTSRLSHFRPVRFARYWPTGPSAVMLVVSPKQTWPTSTLILGMGIHVLGQRADLRVEVGRLAGRAAVAVELDVGQVQPMPVDRLHPLERRLPVARHAQVQAVHVDRMGQAELVDGTGQARGDLPGASRRNGPRDRPSRPARPLPCFHCSTPPGFTTLTPKPLGGVEQPGDGLARADRRRRHGPGRGSRGDSPSGRASPCRRAACRRNSAWACRAPSGGIAASTAVV